MNPSVQVLIYKTFGDLDREIRMSVINLFLALSGVDRSTGNYDLKQQYISSYRDTLNVDADSCISQFFNHGNEKLIDDLAVLSHEQKEILVLSVFDLLGCDGKPSEKELNAMVSLFDQIGVDEDEIVAIMEKGISINKKFM